MSLPGLQGILTEAQLCPHAHSPTESPSFSSFVLTETVSVSVAIVKMDGAKSNLIFFGKKIEFSTL